MMSSSRLLNSSIGLMEEEPQSAGGAASQSVSGEEEEEEEAMSDWGGTNTSVAFTDVSILRALGGTDGQKVYAVFIQITLLSLTCAVPEKCT